MALLEARGISKSFLWESRFSRARRLQAVDRVDLDVERGECVAVVGESGSGKTTLGRCLLRLTEPDAGTVRFDGQDLNALKPPELRLWRRQFQMVFQNSGGAFDPRLEVRHILEEPLAIHRIGTASERGERIEALLAQVGLGTNVLRRHAHELSGGQRQRLGIARALAVEPRLLVLDEPVAALDVSVQARILRLLEELRRDLGLAMVFISHDLAVVRQIADKVAVLYLGRKIEAGPRDRIFQRPQHPYTASLLASVPSPDPARQRGAPLEGEIPSPLDPPSGCRFHPRCPIARAHCRVEEPHLQAFDGGRMVVCHHPGEMETTEHLR